MSNLFLPGMLAGVRIIGGDMSKFAHSSKNCKKMEKSQNFSKITKSTKVKD